MDEARRLIQAEAIQGTAFVLAREQTAGRGTHGREWVSPAGAGIYLTVIHQATDPSGFPSMPFYPLAAGVACVEALQTVLGIEVQLKPINDLMVQGRKLGGILVESEQRQTGLQSILTGIGLNITDCARQTARMPMQPICLEEIVPHCSPDRIDQLVETMVAKICFNYALLFRGQTGQVLRRWQTHQLPGTLLPAQYHALFQAEGVHGGLPQ